MPPPTSTRGQVRARGRGRGRGKQRGAPRGSGRSTRSTAKTGPADDPDDEGGEVEGDSAQPSTQQVRPGGGAAENVPMELDDTIAGNYGNWTEPGNAPTSRKRKAPPTADENGQQAPAYLDVLQRLDAQEAQESQPGASQRLGNSCSHGQPPNKPCSQPPPSAAPVQRSRAAAGSGPSREHTPSRSPTPCGDDSRQDQQEAASLTGQQQGGEFAIPHTPVQRQPGLLANKPDHLLGSYTERSKACMINVKVRLDHLLLTANAFPSHDELVLMIRRCWREASLADTTDSIAVTPGIEKHFRQAARSFRSGLKNAVAETVRQHYPPSNDKTITDADAYLKAVCAGTAFLHRTVREKTSQTTGEPMLAGCGLPFAHPVVKAVLRVIAFDKRKGAVHLDPAAFQGLPTPLLAFTAILIRNALDGLIARQAAPLTTSSYGNMYQKYQRFIDEVAESLEHGSAFAKLRSKLWVELRDYAGIDSGTSFAIDFEPEEDDRQ